MINVKGIKYYLQILSYDVVAMLAHFDDTVSLLDVVGSDEQAQRDIVVFAVDDAFLNLLLVVDAHVLAIAQLDIDLPGVAIDLNLDGIHILQCDFSLG
jgi:hypothetical protein